MLAKKREKKLYLKKRNRHRKHIQPSRACRQKRKYSHCRQLFLSKKKKDDKFRQKSEKWKIIGYTKKGPQSHICAISSTSAHKFIYINDCEEKIEKDTDKTRRYMIGIKRGKIDSNTVWDTAEGNDDDTLTTVRNKKEEKNCK